MASNFLQPGDVLDLTAPTGGVVAGVGVIIDALLVIALDTAAQTLPFRGAATGVWSHAKAGSQAWAEGEAVYFDDSGKVFSTVATVGFFRAGVAAEAVAGGAGDTTGKVRLDGTATFPVSATYVAR
jgi:predicted RecA/RadA family phage recombinase